MPFVSGLADMDKSGPIVNNRVLLFTYLYIGGTIMLGLHFTLALFGTVVKRISQGSSKALF